MTGQQFREARVAAGLSVRRAAAELGVAPSTIHRWQMGEMTIPSETAERITALAAGHSAAPEVARTLGRIYRVLETILGKPVPPSIAEMVKGSPAAAFGKLIPLAMAANAARYHAHEEELTALFGDVPDYPDFLNSAAEGEFWLGYYGRARHDNETSGAGSES